MSTKTKTKTGTARDRLVHDATRLAEIKAVEVEIDKAERLIAETKEAVKETRAHLEILQGRRRSLIFDETPPLFGGDE